MTTLKVGKFGLLLVASLIVAVLFLFHSNAPVYATGTCSLSLTHEETVLLGDYVAILAEVMCVQKNGRTKILKHQYKKVCVRSPYDPNDSPAGITSCLFTSYDLASFQMLKLGTWEVTAEVLSGRHKGLSAESTYVVLSGS